MTARATPFLVLALAAGLVGMAASLLLDDPVPVALTAPFALAALASLAAPPPSIARVTMRTPRDQMVVGEEIPVTVCVEGRGLHWVELELRAASHLVNTGPRRRIAAAGVDTDLVLRAERWGGGGTVTLDICGRGLLGLRTVRHRSTLGHGLRIYPPEHRLRELVAPRTLAAVGGQHTSRDRGDGYDYAESRPYVRGDRFRDVNWRMTARRGAMWIDQRHPERSGSVVLFVDSFATSALGRDATLARAVEAGVSVAKAYLGANDRLGLVDLGGTLRWVPTRSGRRHSHVVVETLVDSEVIETWADKDLDIIPPMALPAGALVVALTALSDPRIMRTLLQLRARQYELVVIESAGPPAPGDPRDPVNDIARRLAALEHDAIRGSLRRSGASLVTWEPDTPLDPLLRQLVVERHRPRAGTGAGT